MKKVVILNLTLTSATVASELRKKHNGVCATKA
jgi:hypothetical protein